MKDSNGEIVEIICTYDPSTKPGVGEWRSVKGTIHWVSESHSKETEVRLFDRLFTEPDMDSLPEDKDYKDFLNPKSLETVIAHVEPDLFADKSIVPVQFERLGYFIKDSDSTGDKFVYNRTVGLKSNFSA